jgi:hypothetical protein
MDMIGHPAIRVDAMPVSCQTLLKIGFPLIPIGRIEINGLSTVTPQNHMIEAAGQMQPGFAWHWDFSS